MKDLELENLKLNHIDACGELVKSRYRTSVKPVYGVKGSENIPYFIGSCTFVSDEINYFCVSAAHVFDHLKDTSLFALDEEFIALTGELISTVTPNGDREEDHMDVAVLRLDQSVVDLLENTNFVNKSDFLIGSPEPHQKYASLLGYPLSKHKKPSRANSPIIIQLYCYTDSMINESGFESNIEYDQSTHILLNHNKQTSYDPDGKKVSSYGTVGVSGGGLFIVEAAVSRSDMEPQNWQTLFAGVLIEEGTGKDALAFANSTTVLKIMGKFSTIRNDKVHS